MSDARPPWDRAGATWWLPVSWPYRAGVSLRRWGYRIGLMPRRQAGVPVISVGGLTVGGVGKTPMVAWLAQAALDQGVPVAIVSRGYGGDPGREPVVVSEGDGVVVQDPSVVGDEPVLLARAVERAIVVVHPNRWEACQRARELGAELVVLDDGLQHARLHRDVDVLLLDARAPLGNGRYVPAGPLRDSPSAAHDVEVVVLTRCELARPDQIASARRLAERLAPDALLGTARHELVGAVPLAPTGQGHWAPAGAPQSLEGLRVFAMSGIARPADFVASLQRAGAEVVGSRGWPDHHRFTAAELAGVFEAAGDARVITTAKDATRLPQGNRDVLCACLEMRLEADVEHELRGHVEDLTGGTSA